MEFTNEPADQASNLATAELEPPVPKPSPAVSTTGMPSAVSLRRSGAAAVPDLRQAVSRTVDIRADYTQELPRPDAPVAGAGAGAGATALRARYVLEEKIGEGGTSVVYRARDLRRDPAAPGGQRVALKLLRPGLRGQTRAVERLKREFHHSQTLSHPAIARVYDVDCDGDQWFLTLELLDGDSLATLMDRAGGPLPQRRVLDILRACGDALTFAHERGVVHGDFKPGNVFVTTGGQVRVLDFGSASSSWLNGLAQITTATPAYASPEVLSGQRPELRDDVFSFACVAYEMLTGRHPFDRRTALDARNADRVPERDWNLAARQWHALESGLAWSREERPGSIRALVGEVTTASEMPMPIIMPDIREPPAQFRSPRLAPISAFAALAALGAVVFVAHSQLDDLPGGVPEVVSRAKQVVPNVLLGGPRVAEATPVPASRSTQAPPQVPGLSTTPPARQASASPAAATPGGTSNESVRRRAQRLSAAPSALPARQPSEPALGGAPEPSGREGASESEWQVPTGSTGGSAIRWQDDAVSVAALVSFDVESVTVSEGASSAVLRINRRHQLDGRAMVLWRTLAGSARPGADFREVARGVAQFADGQTTRAIYVPLLNDLDFERDESFAVELYSPDGMTRINPIARVRVTVRDNDAANEYRVAEQPGRDTHTR